MGIKKIFKKKEKNTLKDFKKENLLPIFTTMAIADNAEYIGIESSNYVNILSNPKNLHTSEINEQVANFITEINEFITDEDFLKKVFAKISFIKNYGQFDVDENVFKGIYHSEKEQYELTVSFQDKNVTFDSNYNDIYKTSGKYQKQDNGKSYSMYCVEKDVVFFLEDKDSHDIRMNKMIETYDKDGVQTFRYEEEKLDNFYMMKDTQKKVLCDSDIFANYQRKSYMWRTSKDILLRRETTKYVNPSLDSSYGGTFHLIGINVCPEDKKLPHGGDFIWYDNELHQKYKEHKCELSELWMYRGNKYQKMKSKNK